MVSFDVTIKLFPSIPLIIYKPSFKSPTENLIEFWLYGSFIYLLSLLVYHEEMYLLAFPDYDR